MAEISEGKLYSRLYVQAGNPQSDSKRLRERLASYFNHELRGRLALTAGQAIQIETGWQDVLAEHYHYTPYLLTAPIEDVLSAITLIWRAAAADDYERRHSIGHATSAAKWLAFVDRALSEENVSYRVDAKCGVHPRIDQEFDRNKTSALACLADKRYAAVEHALASAFDDLNRIPMDGKDAARNVFEAAESMFKIVTPAGGQLDERAVDKFLRPICDRLFGDDAQLKSMAGRLLSSFGKWVDAMHAYRHGHDREQPLVLPDDVAVLTVSEGAAFIRWLVDLDARNREKTEVREQPVAKAGD